MDARGDATESRSAGWRAGVRDILSLFRDILAADVLELRAWGRMGAVGYFLLAAYVAVMVEPLVYGSLGTSIVALMMPVK